MPVAASLFHSGFMVALTVTGWKVRAEVPTAGGFLDVVAERNGEVIAFELDRDGPRPTSLFKLQHTDADRGIWVDRLGHWGEVEMVRPALPRHVRFRCNPPQPKIDQDPDRPPETELERRIAEINALQHTLGAEDYEALRCGNDHWSRLDEDDLRPVAEEAWGEKALSSIARLSPKNRAAALRWICRGLSPFHAAAKIRHGQMRARRRGPKA